MTENPPLHDMRRAANILTGDGQITTDKFEQDTFVVYNGQVAVGGSRLSHSTIVFNLNFCYPGTKDEYKPTVDDGGQIYDNGDALIIPDYFTSSTRPKLLWDAAWKHTEEQSEGIESEINLDEVRKIVRKNTGTLVANITGRKVIVKHSDKTEDILLPNTDK